MSIFLLSSCDKNDDLIFEGDSALQFNFGTDAGKTVESGAGTAEAVIEYGTLTAVSGAHQVKLIYDAAKSTAVPGVDFTLVNGGEETLAAGQSMGQFKVNILESGATPVPKVAVFTLSSPSLPNATFNQEYTLTMSLRCPITTLIGTGNFNYTGWWNGSGGYQIIQGTTPNTLEVVDWLDIGVNLILKYDDNGIITFDQQDTGYPFQSGPNNYTIRMSTTAVSTYDTCARKINLKAFWFVPNVGSFGEKTEDFTGI